MHTVKVIAAGFVLLVLCLLIGRWLGGANEAGATAGAIKTFLVLWLIGAGVNMWVGVARAGYSVAEEAPGLRSSSRFRQRRPS